MEDEYPNIATINICHEQQNLLEAAKLAPSRRAGRTLFHGQGMRQTMIALLGETELAEHESPLEAFLQVLKGKVVIHGRQHEWQVSAGELISLPAERHSVSATENSVITLTVLRHPSVFERKNGQ